MKVLRASMPFIALVNLMVVAPAVADPVDTLALTVPKAMKLLQSEGYYDFRKIKVEHDEHEIKVEARNESGQKVELEMDLYTGKILDVELD
ncbi:PepSY domain-containing protein [Photobacterium lipolyticum]|uniref:PepSY domain-containing protein n=1 Tax=Photobacterium lipolyticum TaxID=266810 RepID=A0A2T3MZA6_9GAMM|nr:PepSY domain-containing protein [Photobacterium lipolyticum]PSW05199.1 PepSY domain-containing protein [Photobacterium lipolyticum]